MIGSSGFKIVLFFFLRSTYTTGTLSGSVADPDPYVLGFPDPDVSLFCTVPTDPDSSVNNQKSKKPILRLLFDFLYMKTDVNVPLKLVRKKLKRKKVKIIFCWNLVTLTRSGSVNQ